MRHIAWVCVALFSVTASAAIKSEEVRYQAGDTNLVGTAVYDDGAPSGKPGIIIFPEWWGANDYVKSRAKMLAELGYVAFVADMYGEAKTTEDPKVAGELAKAVYSSPDTMLARANAALSAVRGIKGVDPARIGAIGYCMGGNVALNFAGSGADLRSVVAFHAGLANRLKSPGTVKAAILVCNGADDKTITEEEQREFIQAMREAKADWQLVLFGGAVHSFTNPGADKYRDLGSVGYDAKADKRSWQLMRNHLQTTLGGLGTDTKASAEPINPR